MPKTTKEKNSTLTKADKNKPKSKADKAAERKKNKDKKASKLAVSSTTVSSEKSKGVKKK